MASPVDANCVCSCENAVRVRQTLSVPSYAPLMHACGLEVRVSACKMRQRTPTVRKRESPRASRGRVNEHVRMCASRSVCVSLRVRA
eukprot:2953035-Pleurochrysis_carterae.AAC.4